VLHSRAQSYPHREPLKHGGTAQVYEVKDPENRKQLVRINLGAKHPGCDCCCDTRECNRSSEILCDKNRPILLFDRGTHTVDRSHPELCIVEEMYGAGARAEVERTALELANTELASGALTPAICIHFDLALTY
jgi:hypothetical protein